MAASAPARHSHRISEEEVLRAEALAKKGEQRLYNIVNGQPNAFTFNIPFDQGRTASVEFHIDPVASNLAQHALYAITGRYTPSDEDVQSDKVLERAQLVYDTYIRVSWLRLDEKCFERRPLCRPLPSPPPSIDLNPPQKRQTPPCDIDEGSESHASAPSVPLSSGRKRLRANSCSDGQSRSGANSNSTVGDLSTSATKLSLIVDNLVKKIKSGLSRRENKGKRPLPVISIDQAVAGCISSMDDDKKLDKYLNDVEKVFKQAIKLDESDVKRRTWTTWMFLSCFRLVREKRRKGRKHVPSQAAKLFNLIINHLLVSEGAMAVGVYEALAEHCYKACDASRLSVEDIENTSVLVANKLRDQMPRSLDSSLIPFPGAWLSVVFPNIPYPVLCEDIGLPNLAHVKLEAEWSQDGQQLVIGVRMSEIRGKWDAFISANPNWKEGRDQLESGDLGILEAADGCSLNVLAASHGHANTIAVAHPAVVPSGEDGIGDVASLGYNYDTVWEAVEDGEGQITDLDSLLMDWPVN